LNCLLNHVIEGDTEISEDEEDDGSSYRMALKKGEIGKVQRGSTRSHSLEKSLWKRL
jgi:hypothetical protein